MGPIQDTLCCRKSRLAVPLLKLLKFAWKSKAGVVGCDFDIRSWSTKKLDAVRATLSMKPLDVPEVYWALGQEIRTRGAVFGTMIGIEAEMTQVAIVGIGTHAV
jgi:hypothetical protein